MILISHGSFVKWSVHSLFCMVVVWAAKRYSGRLWISPDKKGDIYQVQCATGNLWSVLGHAVSLSEQPWVKMNTEPQSKTAEGAPKFSFGSHPVLLLYFISSVWVGPAKDVTMCNWQFLVCLVSCCVSFWWQLDVIAAPALNFPSWLSYWLLNHRRLFLV